MEKHQEQIPVDGAADRDLGTKEDLLGLAVDRKEVRINGKRYVVRGMTADEEARIGNLAQDNVHKKKLNAVLVSLTLEDSNGNRIFQDSEVDKIAKLPGRDVRTIVNAALEASGLDEETRKALGKGSGGIDDDGSSSA